MPTVPIDLPQAPPQVFALATPAHVLAKLYWEIKNLRAHMHGSRDELMSHLHASYMAFNTAVTAWHLCDWVFHSWQDIQRKEVMAEMAPGANVTPAEFRTAMAKASRELKICQQIANGSKHMKCRFSDATIGVSLKWQLASQPAVSDGDPGRSYGWDLVVRDGGTERAALEVFDEVFRFWRRELATWGFIEDWLVPEDGTLAG